METAAISTVNIVPLKPNKRIILLLCESICCSWFSNLSDVIE